MSFFYVVTVIQQHTAESAPIDANGSNGGLCRGSKLAYTAGIWPRLFSNFKLHARSEGPFADSIAAGSLSSVINWNLCSAEHRCNYLLFRVSV